LQRLLPLVQAVVSHCATPSTVPHPYWHVVSDWMPPLQVRSLYASQRG
jgi:hypothetical protein